MVDSGASRGHQPGLVLAEVAAPGTALRGYVRVEIWGRSTRVVGDTSRAWRAGPPAGCWFIAVACCPGEHRTARSAGTACWPLGANRCLVVVNSSPRETSPESGRRDRMVASAPVLAMDL